VHAAAFTVRPRNPTRSIWPIFVRRSGSGNGLSIGVGLGAIGAAVVGAAEGASEPVGVGAVELDVAGAAVGGRASAQAARNVARTPAPTPRRNVRRDRLLPGRWMSLTASSSVTLRHRAFRTIATG